MLRTRRPSVTAVPTEFGQVLLDRRKGRYFHLNGTATTIADSLREGIDGDVIAEHFARAACLALDQRRAGKADKGCIG